MLVSLGVYSVIAYTVSRQTHEIGIRMALGAARRDVLKMVLRMGLRLERDRNRAGADRDVGSDPRDRQPAVGTCLRTTRDIGQAWSSWSLCRVAACYFPARRATRVDPMVALRYGVIR